MTLRMILSRMALCACLAAEAMPSAWCAPAPAQEEAQPSVHEMEQNLRERAWEFDVASLPAAETERWAEWKPQDPAPKAAADPYDFAYEAYRKGDFVLAAGYLQRLLVAEPEYPPALQLLALSYRGMDRLEESALCFERALRAAPQVLPQTRSYAECLLDLERFEEAIQHATRLIELRPKDARLLALRGSAHLEMKQYKQAWSDLLAAKNLDSEHPFVLYAVARYLVENDDPGAASKAAVVAADADPYSPEPWKLVAKSALALENDLNFRERRSLALARVQQLEEVEGKIRALKTAWLRQPSDIQKLEAIAGLHKEVGNLDKAEQVLKRAGAWAQEFGDQRALRRIVKALKELP